MSIPLRLLLVEDGADDAQLLLRHLTAGGYTVTHRRVETAAELKEALAAGGWEVILCDWCLPSFSAPDALAVVAASGLDLPFIIVSGTIADDMAVNALTSGAHDFIAKDRLARLVPAVARELREAAVRRSEREAREALLESERLLRLVTESVPEGIVATDACGKIRVANVAARRLLGVRNMEHLHANRGADDASAPQHGLYLADGSTLCSPCQWPLARALRGETIEAQELVVGETEGAPRRLISMSARPMRDDACALRGAVAVIRDITDERTMQQQLLVSDRMASLGVLASGVTHEINGPLTSLIVNVHLAGETADRIGGQASDGLAGQEILAELRDAHEAGQRIVATLHDVGAFCHRTSVESASIELQPVIESAIRMAWNQIRPRAELVRNYAATPNVRADESLCQVFLNLLMISAQSLPEREKQRYRIEISTQLAGDGSVVAEVKDTGSCTPPQALQGLFIPGVTARAAGLRSDLALATSQRIVKSLGGRLEVASMPGRGNLFRVVLLPAAATPPAQPVVPVRRAAAARGRVLIVDDEPLVTRSLRRLLRSHDLCSENTGRAALKLLAAKERFDVILCDLTMPDLPAADLLAELRRLDPLHLERLIFLTGKTFSKGESDELEAACVTCLEKPFDPDYLRALVSSRVGGQSR